MTHYRLVTLDMDGTILASDGSLSQRMTRAIREARARGVVVALATARRWTGAVPIVAELGLQGAMIIYDGAMARTFPGGAVEMRRMLDDGVVQRVVEALAAHELQVVTQYGDAQGERLLASASPRHPQWMRSYLERFREQITYLPLDAIAAASSETLRVVSFGPEARLRAAFDSLGDAPVGRQIMPEGSYGLSELTVFSPQASKGFGLRWLAKRLGVSMERTLAIGDGVNDISMLREAGMSVAMGNAAQEVQEAARAVTATNDEDGAALAIERYVLDEGGADDAAEETA